jgi:hypothetical protein
MSNRIRLLKQVTEIDHLKDCISNGFIFRDNKVIFPTNISEVIEQTVQISLVDPLVKTIILWV